MNTKSKMLSDWSEVTSGERNEIVFERLNKTYGAYEIRTNYDNTLTKAFSFTLLFTALLAVSFLICKEIPKTIVKFPDVPTYSFTTTSTDEKTYEQKKIEEPSTPKNLSTDKLKPEVTDEEIKQTDLPKNPDRPYSAAGNPSDTGSREPFTPISGGEEKPIEGETPIDAIAVQELPEFPGGEEERQRFLLNNLHIPEMIKEMGSIKERIGIVFVVKKDGSISDIDVFQGGSKYAQLNNEALRVIKKMPAWKPGRQNGAPVCVRMIMPIQFVVK